MKQAALAVRLLNPAFQDNRAGVDAGLGTLRTYPELGLRPCERLHAAQQHVRLHQAQEYDVQRDFRNDMLITG